MHNLVYDLAGNRETDAYSTLPGGYFAGSTETRTGSFNSVNQLGSVQTEENSPFFWPDPEAPPPPPPADTYSYDANGNLSGRVFWSGGSNTFEWDAANRLTAITYSGGTSRTEFTYDGLSHRKRIVEKTGGTVTSTKQFIWIGDRIAEERDGSNNITRRYFAHGEQRIGGTDASLYYYSKDHLGSTRELSGAAGALRARYDYDPFGNTSKVSGDLNLDFGYTGHYRHAPSNLYLAPYRAYDPTIGRWLSRDPIGEEGGLNLYGYVLNNPINLIDPLGLEDFRMFPPNESWRRQFDSGPNTYDIGSHGNPNVVIDEHGNRLSPQDLLNRVKNDPNFQNAKNVRLWACEVGQGKNSFAQQFADLSGKPTSGPNQTFWEHGRNGTVAPTGANGNPPGGLGGFLGRMFSWNWRNFNPR